MLTSVRTDHRMLFKALRCVVVDEMHAFAGTIGAGISLQLWKG